jgi:hypothetical protein
VSVTVRVSRPVVLAGAACALVAVAAGARVAWGGDAYRVDGPAPATVTVEDVVLDLTGQQPVLAVTVSPADPSRLLVDVGSPAGCAHARVRVSAQDDRAVRLEAYAYHDPAAGGPDDGTACAAPVAVDLGAPLGHRRVVEQGTYRVLVTGDVS